MKLAFVEAEGFRGFRDKVRIDFARVFTVLTGRNGVGKSTIFDAIEYALTGTLSKYRVDKSGADKLEDYIWWRGQGTSASNYVKVGFVDDQNRTFEVVRDRSREATKPEEIERTLCTPDGKPENALRHMCQTSIIRDELITALSFDLTEGERFALVYDAQGSIDNSDHGRRAQEILVVAKRTADDSQRAYDDARDRLSQSLADLATAKDRASKAGDITAALSLLDAELPGIGDSAASKLAAARKTLTDRRIRLGTLTRLGEDERSLLADRAALNTAELQSRKAALLARRKDLEAQTAEAAALLSNAKKVLALEEQKDSLANALSDLLRHGDHVGLHDGRCPLCNANRTPGEFARGMRALEVRLQSSGSDIRGARAAVENATIASAAATAQLDECIKSITELESRESSVRAKESALAQKLNALADSAHHPKFGQVQQFVAHERSRLVDLERAILTLEASRSIDQIAELEAKTETVRTDSDLLSQRLAKAKRAHTVARDLDHAVRRARVEVSDERLASLRPILTDFYQRLRPHSDWKTIRYSIRGDVTRLLSLRVGDDINPQFVFSSGQRRAAGLAFLFAVHVSRPWCLWQSLLLDDPVQHIDDFRALHLVEVLAALGSTRRQVICGVEDPALADLMYRRLLGSSASDGLRYELERVADGSTGILQVKRVQPMLRGLMRSASGESIAG
jgi:chromosome segregation protein